MNIVLEAPKMLQSIFCAPHASCGGESLEGRNMRD